MVDTLVSNTSSARSESSNLSEGTLLIKGWDSLTVNSRSETDTSESCISKQFLKWLLTF